MDGFPFSQEMRVEVQVYGIKYLSGLFFLTT